MIKYQSSSRTAPKKMAFWFACNAWTSRCSGDGSGGLATLFPHPASTATIAMVQATPMFLLSFILIPHDAGIRMLNRQPVVFIDNHYQRRTVGTSTQLIRFSQFPSPPKSPRQLRISRWHLSTHVFHQIQCTTRCYRNGIGWVLGRCPFRRKADEHSLYSFNYQCTPT